MRINHNIAALNTYRQLAANSSNSAKSLEKLSSGLRINRAGDDAAGLAISEKMRGQIRGLQQASRNAQDGISLIQTAEGALSETHSILQRVRELAVQGANDTLETADRSALQTELDQLVTEIGRIATTTQFNGKTLLTGTLGVSRTGGTLDTAIVGLANLSDIGVTDAAASTTYTLTETATHLTLTKGAGDAQTIDKSTFTAGDTFNFDSLGVTIKTDSQYDTSGIVFVGTIITGASTGATLQVGANAGDELSLAIGDMQATALSVDSLSVTTNAGAEAAITAVDAAIGTVSTQRATLGAYQNRLEHSINNLSAASENMTAAESRIRDVDMASEMMEFTKNSILTQAATAMLAQANQQPQGVLQLLR